MTPYSFALTGIIILSTFSHNIFPKAKIVEGYTDSDLQISAIFLLLNF